MPRPVMFDCVSSNLQRETINKEQYTRERWFKDNKDEIWTQSMGPIQGRVMKICHDKDELMRKLMDSKDEYFKYCKQGPPEKPKSCFDQMMVLQVGPDPCDECFQDPTIPMRTPHPDQRAKLFEGISHDGRGAKGYLRDRYDMGLPETKFCYPPTTNSEYAWKLLENILSMKSSRKPRLATIGPAFYRSRGVLCRADYAPYHFPMNYC